MRKLADNERILIAAPAYLQDRGRPADLADLINHELLRYGDTSAPLRLTGPAGRVEFAPAPGRLCADNDDAIHHRYMAGLGVALKSRVDVAADLRSGTLEQGLPGWHWRRVAD